MKRILPFLYIASIIVLFTSCEEKSDPASDATSFTKIISNSQFNTAYYPIDMKQTPDEGYLILCEKKLYDSTSRFTYLIKVDKYGEVVKDMEIDTEIPNLNPVADLMEVAGSYYFFYMEGTTTYLAKTDADLSVLTPIEIKVPGGENGTPLHYPAAASYDGTNFELLTYDYQNREFIVSLFAVTGGESIKSESYGIELSNDVEGPIIDHFNHTGKQFPFKVGKLASGGYYFNGFVNYSFSLIFLDNNLKNQGIGGIHGQRTKGGVSSLIEVTSGNYALSTFNFGSNYFKPVHTQKMSDSISVGDVGGNALLELKPDAKVKSIKIEVKSTPVIIYGSNTTSNQIGLYVYNQTTGEFISSRYFGYSDPYEISQLTPTSDGGLAVVGITYTVGRFARICIFKLSKAELEGLVK